MRVRITTFPSRATAATGVIEDVLGRADDERVAVDVVIARHKLETSFSEGALAEAHAAVLDEDGALASGYRDLRDQFTLTIDPAERARLRRCGISHEADEVSERAAGRAPASASWMSAGSGRRRGGSACTSPTWRTTCRGAPRSTSTRADAPRASTSLTA